MKFQSIRVYWSSFEVMPDQLVQNSCVWKEVAGHASSIYRAFSHHQGKLVRLLLIQCVICFFSAQAAFTDIYYICQCLWPVYASDGLQITTIEGIGSLKNDYHPIQKALYHFNGTQCGYCSPGFRNIILIIEFNWKLRTLIFLIINLFCHQEWL